MTARRVFSFVCLLVAAACGGGGPAHDAGTTADAASDGLTSCFLATQSPCGAGEQCSPFCRDSRLVVACRAEPAMPVAVGGTCGAAMICERGSTCLAAAGMPIQCMKLCIETADCPGTRTCRDVTVSYSCSSGMQTMSVRACI